MKNGFEVRPVSRYDGARYLSTYAPPPPDHNEERKHHPLHVLLALVLVLGLTAGVIGCFADYKSDPCALGLLPKNPNGSCDPPDPDDDCIAGLHWCDSLTLFTCMDDGSGWTSQDCDAYCRDALGLGGYSTGCDIQADDPCQCEYDIIDGDIAVCTPGEIACWGDQTLATCQDNGWEWMEQNCEDFCNEKYGYDAYSLDCDAQAEEPCQCETDIMDGVMPACSPDEMWCQDDETVMICDEQYWSYTPVDCDTYCTETFGEHYYSDGCDDTNEENICGCEYGIVDGEPVP
jgi:hypothetical protein